MTTLADLNPFTQIVSHPHVVPQAVERVISAGVSADYLNRRLLANARADLLTAQHGLSVTRLDPKATAEAHVYAQALLYRAIDRAWEAQCMANGVFG